MAKSHFLRLLVFIVTLSFLLNKTVASGEYSWMTTNKLESSCKGSIAECLSDTTGEFDMDSETTHRILAANDKYISYGALLPNNVPCSRRGASYYNCKSGAEANPYTRSCSAATQCRGG